MREEVEIVGLVSQYMYGSPLISARYERRFTLCELCGAMFGYVTDIHQSVTMP